MQCRPAALATTAHTVLAALALMVALGYGLPPPRQLYGASLSGALCVLGWSLGHHCLHVVFGERLLLVGPGDADPNAPLLAVLGSDSPILQVRPGVGAGAGSGARPAGRRWTAA
jgi:hypothetical protein